MDTLLSLDIVGRALALPQSNVPEEWMGGWNGVKVEGVGGEEGVGTGIGMQNEKR